MASDFWHHKDPYYFVKFGSDCPWEKPKEDTSVAKQVVHVGVALATDGPVAGRDNILAIGATIGGNEHFTINVSPHDRKYKTSAYWEKHPEEFSLIQKDPVKLSTAIDAFDTWLKKWQGRLIACTSNLDFWYIFTAFMEHTELCPFGSIPIDTNSFYCGYNGLKTPGKISDKVMPLDIAKERWQMVTQGAMPVFGKQPPAKRKAGNYWRVPPPPPQNIRWEAVTQAPAPVFTEEGLRRAQQLMGRYATAAPQQNQATPRTFVIDSVLGAGQREGR